jgi:hypothetical protein
MQTQRIFKAKVIRAVVEGQEKANVVGANVVGANAVVVRAKNVRGVRF